MFPKSFAAMFGKRRMAIAAMTTLSLSVSLVAAFSTPAQRLYGISSNECQLFKGPIVQVYGDNEVNISWETSTQCDKFHLYVDLNDWNGSGERGGRVYESEVRPAIKNRHKLHPNKRRQDLSASSLSSSTTNNSDDMLAGADGKGAAASPSQQIGLGDIFRTDIDSTHHLYHARLRGLRVGATYACKLEQEDGRVYDFSFNKYGQEIDILTPGPLTFAFVGESAGNDFMFGRLANLMMAYKRPSYLAHLGNAVQAGASMAQWQSQFFDPLSNALVTPSKLLMLVPGKGEMAGDGRPIYLPQDKLYYATTIANIRWIVLDSNDESLEQGVWLQQELASPASTSASFRIVMVNAAPFVEYWDRLGWLRQEGKASSAFIRYNYVPLFEKYQVDLVISGHQHNYQRGTRNGVKYVITGGAGAPIHNNKVEDYGMYEVTSFANHYCTLSLLSADQVEFSMVSAQNELLDTFILARKRVFVWAR